MADQVQKIQISLTLLSFAKPVSEELQKEAEKILLDALKG